MVNRVVLIGRLTHNPELRHTASDGVAVTTFSLAVNRKFTNQNGEREADFINIVTWRRLAQNCAKYLGKGSLVALEGKLQSRKYENQEGRIVYVTEVVADDVRFLDSRKPKQQQTVEEDPFKNDGKPIEIDDDDLPF